VKNQNINVWFSSTGKKKALKRLGQAAGGKNGS